MGLYVWTLFYQFLLWSVLKELYKWLYHYYYNHKMCHQTNLRFVLDIYLCDLGIWVKVIANIARARSQWIASMVLVMYL